MTALQLILVGLGFWAVNAAIAPQAGANAKTLAGRLVLFGIGGYFWISGMILLLRS